MRYYEYITKIQLSRLQRLQAEPKGFFLEADGTYNCLICHAVISGENGWYDIHGEKCLSCQNAVNNGVVPTSICADRQSWYSSYELTNKFKLTNSSLSSMVRDGKLKSRKIKSITGSTTFEIFIKMENEVLDSLARARRW